MALKTLIFSFIILSFHFHTLTTTTANAEEEPSFFVRSLDREMIENQEKFSHFRFYWQDVVGGANPTAIEIIPPLPKFNTAFGLVRIIDNALTSGPQLNSKVVGRAQGFYASESQTEFSFLMVQNFVLSEGVYDGSSITIMGRNPVTQKVRELPVVGGSGLFRLAKGYAKASTIAFDPKSGDATVEYNVYVSHY